jgi:hypothetical protein
VRGRVGVVDVGMAAEVDRDDPEIEARPVGAPGLPGSGRRRRGKVL